MKDSVLSDALVIPRRTGVACAALPPSFDDFKVLRFKLFLVHLFAIEQAGVAWIDDAHFLEHLTHDDLDVLVIDVHALEAVDLLHLVHEVLLQFAHAANFENFVRDHDAISQLLAFDHMVARLDDQVLGMRNEMLLFHAGHLISHDNDALVFLNAAEVDDAIDFGNLCRIFRFARFEKLGNPRKTACDVLCLHRRRVADGLRAYLLWHTAPSSTEMMAPAGIG